MKALKVFEPGRAEVVDVPAPKPSAGEVLLRPEALGLCGTDLAIFLGTNPLVTYPRIIGHEVAASVVDVADDVTSVNIGDRVAVWPVFPCGKCHVCRRGRINCCIRSETPGVHREGCASELFVMPVEKLHRAPDNMDSESLALAEPMTIGRHAANRARIGEGDTVLVIGAGPVGLGAMQSARMLGARVASCDIRDLAVDLARRLGADLAINNARDDLAKAMDEWTGGDGPLVVIEAAGDHNMMEAAVELVAQAGRVVIVGYAKQRIELAPDMLVKKELDLMGSRNSLEVFDDVLDGISGGGLRVREMVTHRFSLEEGADALSFWAENREDVCKIVLTFD